jgi:hypothetical protein
MLHVIHAPQEKVADVIVRQPIEDSSSLASAAHEMHLSQPTKLMRHRRFTHAQVLG